MRARLRAATHLCGLLAALVLLVPGTPLRGQPSSAPGDPAPAGAGPVVRSVSRWLSVNGQPGQSPAQFLEVDGTLCLPTESLEQYLGLRFTIEASSGVISVDFFGASVVARAGDPRLQTPMGMRDLPCAPFLQGTGAVLPLRPLAEALGMVVTETPDRTDVSLAPAQILSVRQEETAERFRATVELAAPTPFFAVAAPSVISVGLATAEGFCPPERATTIRDARGNLVAQPPPAKLSIPVQGVLGHEVTIENLAGGLVRIGAHGRYGVVGQRCYTLARPFRIVLEFPKIWDTQRSQSPGQDVEATWFSFGTSAGPIVAYAAHARVSAGRVTASVLRAGEYSYQRAPLSGIAQRAGAIAAVNGGFFAPDSGDPIGTLIQDGEWVRFPYAQRTALLIGRDGRLSMGNVGARGQVTIGGQAVAISGLNEWLPGSGECVKVVSRKWRDSWPVIAGQAALQVRRGAVAQVVAPTSRVELATPPDGYLVVGCGEQTKRWLAAVRTGTRVDFAAWLEPHVPDVVAALGGGPRIVREGAYYNTAEAERIPSDIASSRAPRTAVGITAAGDLLLVVVDGRQPGYSVGMTLPELAQLMLRIGARDAMCLDGGGSSELTIGGTPANRPSDGAERPVPNALAVVRKGD